MITSGWISLARGAMHQKTYGVKTGHVVKRGEIFLALFDGIMIGAFNDEHEAKQAVDEQAKKAAR